MCLREPSKLFFIFHPDYLPKTVSYSSNILPFFLPSIYAHTHFGSTSFDGWFVSASSCKSSFVHSTGLFRSFTRTHVTSGRWTNSFPGKPNSFVCFTVRLSFYLISIFLSVYLALVGVFFFITFATTVIDRFLIFSAGSFFVVFSTHFCPKHVSYIR